MHRWKQAFFSFFCFSLLLSPRGVPLLSFASAKESSKPACRQAGKTRADLMQNNPSVEHFLSQIGD